jgi:predicted Zn finger-like uncharacterized protein
MIRMKCPGCKTRFEFADDLAGKKIRCKACGDTFRVDDADAAPRPSKVASRLAADDDDRPAGRSRRREDDDRRGRYRDESDDELPRRKKANPFLIIGPILGLVVLGAVIFLVVRGLSKKKTDPGDDGEVAKGVVKTITLDVPAKEISQLVVPDNGDRFGLLRNEGAEHFARKWVYEPYDLAAGRRVGKVSLNDVKDPLAVTVSPDGKYVLVTEKHGLGDPLGEHTLWVYSVADGKCLTPQKWYPFPRNQRQRHDSPSLYRAEFVANDRILAIGSDRSYHLFRLPSFDVEKSDKIASTGDPLNSHPGKPMKDWEQRDYQVAFTPDRKRWAVWTGDGYAVLDADGVEQFRTPSSLQMAQTFWPGSHGLERNLRGGGVAFSPDGKTLAGFVQSWTEKERILCLWDANTSQLPETIRMSPAVHNEAAGLKWWGNRYVVLTDMRGAGFQDALDPVAVDAKTGTLMKQVMAPPFRKAAFARDGRLWYAVSDDSNDPARMVVMGPPDADLMEEGTGQYEEIPDLRGSFLKRLWMEPGGVFKKPKRYNPTLKSGLVKQP